MTRPTAASKRIVFDFDGTIADSFDIFVESLAAALGNKQAPPGVNLEDFRRASIGEIISKLGIKKWQLPLVVFRGKREITRRMNRVTVFDGMPEVLAQLSKKHKLYILSTNSEANITNFLATHDLQQYFTAIHADIGLVGKAKALRKLRKKEGGEHDDYIYVGDETRDVDAATKVGMKCVAIGWGYSAPDALAAQNPAGVAQTPRDLVRIISELSVQLA